MSRPSHNDSMQPSERGRTRTAPAQMPDRFPGSGRYFSYMLFGAAAVFFLLMSLLVLRATWALGNGAHAWHNLLVDFQNPAYVVFHVISLLVFVWCGWRFLIKLFPKTQPPRIGPFPRPPLAVFPPLLGAAWLGASALMIIILWGIFP